MFYRQNFIPPTQKSISDVVDKIFKDSFWDDLESTFTQKGWYSEKGETEWLLQIPVPGLTKDDLTIKIIKSNLIVKVNEGNRWTQRFEKTFTLTPDCNLKDVNAKVENGVLNIIIALKEDKENLIEIK